MSCKYCPSDPTPRTKLEIVSKSGEVTKPELCAVCLGTIVAQFKSAVSLVLGYASRVEKNVQIITAHLSI